MRIPRLWLWALLALVIADLALPLTNTRVLIRQQRGDAWLVEGATIVSTHSDVSRYKDKRKIPILACTYWTGIGTRALYFPFAPADQECAWTTR